MTSRRLLVIAPLVLTGALSFAACGSDEGGTDSPSSEASAADVVVTGVDGIKWDAGEYTATAGDVEIMLRNQSSLPHTLAVVAEDGSKVGSELTANSSGDEATGTYALTAGTYTIICTVPGHGAMKADLVVS